MDHPILVGNMKKFKEILKLMKYDTVVIYSLPVIIYLTVRGILTDTSFMLFSLVATFGFLFLIYKKTEKNYYKFGDTINKNKKGITYWFVLAIIILILVIALLDEFVFNNFVINNYNRYF